MRQPVGTAGRDDVPVAKAARRDVRAELRPEMLAALAQSERLYATLDGAVGGLPDDPVAAARLAYAHERRFWNAAYVPVAQVRDLVIGTAAGPLAVRLYRPVAAAAAGLTLYLHGGGHVLGSLDTHDRIMRRLAATSGLPVLGLDYALSPEHRFPVALEQVSALLHALSAEGPGGEVRPEALVLAGDSAGAHLVLGAAIAGRDPRLRGLLLYYGAFGLRDSASRRLFGSEIDGLSPEQLAFYRDAYLGRLEDHDDPRYDCLSAELAGLPPCYLGVVTLDPLRDDSLALAEALEAAGVACTVRRYDGVLHGFLHYGRVLPLADEALAEGGRFIRACLAGEALIPATLDAAAPGK